VNLYNVTGTLTVRKADATAEGKECHGFVKAAVANAADAKRAWLQAALEDGLPVREPDDLENYSGQFKLRIPKSLHRSLAEHARQEGISMNQYCVYLLSRNDAAAR
jgi:predicted HicB family RNase H-like nuclease